MTRVGLKIELDNNALKELRDEIVKDLGRSLRNTFADIRPFVEDAVNAAVESSREEFVPEGQDIEELGIGSNGSPDESRINGAYRQMRTDSNAGITKLSVRKSGAGSSTTFGRITVSIDEDALFESELANVPTPDSSRIDSIPWLQWFIRGAPTNPDWGFLSRRSEASRVGEGIMIRGGLWSFPPVQPFAFDVLSQQIEARITDFIQSDLGDVL